MKITFLCDNVNSWVVPYINELTIILKEKGYSVLNLQNHTELEKGDIAFFLSCEKLIPKKFLQLNKNNIVIHGSFLPKGKGWSPVTWQILEGEDQIPMTLFEAVEKVDAGDIYLQEIMSFNGSELAQEIQEKQGNAVKKLVLEFISQYPNIKGTPQVGEDSFYSKRTSKDSELNIDKTISEQFNLLRVVDNERYPAFFIKDGQKYILKIYKDLD